MRGIYNEAQIRYYLTAAADENCVPPSVLLQMNYSMSSIAILLTHHLCTAFVDPVIDGLIAS